MSVGICNVFVISDYAPNLPPQRSVAELGAIRANEDQLFARQVRGHVGFSDLQRLDAPLRGPEYRSSVRVYRALNPQEMAEATAIAGSLSALLRAGDACAALLLPLALGNHVDHLIAREAGRMALRGRALLGFYEDLPYAGELDEPEIAWRIREVQATFAIGLQPFVSGAGGERQVARKQAIAALYASQLIPEDLTSIMRHARRLGGRERLWASRPLADVLQGLHI